MSKILTAEQKQSILHRAFAKQMDTGAPHGTIALHLLNSHRRETVNESPDNVLARISASVSEGRNTLLSVAYLSASLSPFPLQTGDRVNGLHNMLKYGTPIPGLSVFSDHKNG